MSTRESLIAFLALVAAVLLITLAPVIVSGLLAKNMADSIIAVSDKSVTGLMGVLGSVATLIFRSNRVDEARADNTGKMADAVIAAAAAGTPVQTPDVILSPGQTAQAEEKE